MLTPASPQCTQPACPTKDQGVLQAGRMKRDDRICQRKEYACEEPQYALVAMFVCGQAIPQWLQAAGQ